MVGAEDVDAARVPPMALSSNRIQRLRMVWSTVVLVVLAALTDVQDVLRRSAVGVAESLERAPVLARRCRCGG